MSDPSTTQQRLMALEASPKQIAMLISPLSQPMLHQAPGDNEWSANEVLAHLRACADVWGKYIMTILAEDTPTIRAMSPRTWAKRTDYATLAFHLSFDAFNQQREQLLAVLRGLAGQDWGRLANVIHAAKIKRHSVATYADMLISHEQAHVQQLERIVKIVRELG